MAVYGNVSALFCDGEIFRAALRKSLLRNFRNSSPLAAGDLVEFHVDASGIAVIEKILPRHNALSKPDLLNKQRQQVIAANIDQLVIISSTDKPPFKPGLVDRFLVIAFREKINPVLVLNKIDLRNPADYSEYLKAWEKIGCFVLSTSAVTGEGVSDLAEILKNKISAVTGHSGVGKSTLINAIEPNLKLKTSEISAATGKGVHTTSTAVMYPIAGNGWLIDTPGLKVLDIGSIDKRKLQDYFPEFHDYRDRCRFDDCFHINEPACAVKEAAEAGKIPKFRYLSYVRFSGELD